MWVGRGELGKEKAVRVCVCVFAGRQSRCPRLQNHSCIHTHTHILSSYPRWAPFAADCFLSPVTFIIPSFIHFCPLGVPLFSFSSPCNSTCTPYPHKHRHTPSPLITDDKSSLCEVRRCSFKFFSSQRQTFSNLRTIRVEKTYIFT